jgi:hypothetical protein
MLPFISNLKQNLDCSRGDLKRSESHGSRRRDTSNTHHKSSTITANPADDETSNYYHHVASSSSNENVNYIPYFKSSHSTVSNTNELRKMLKIESGKRSASNNSHANRKVNGDLSVSEFAIHKPREVTLNSTRITSKNATTGSSLYNLNYPTATVRTTVTTGEGVRNTNTATTVPEKNRSNPPSKLQRPPLQANTFISNSSHFQSVHSIDRRQHILIQQTANDHKSDFYLNIKTNVEVNCVEEESHHHRHQNNQQHQEHRYNQRHHNQHTSFHQHQLASSRLSARSNTSNNVYMSDYSLIKNSEEFEFIIDDSGSSSSGGGSSGHSTLRRFATMPKINAPPSAADERGNSIKIINNYKNNSSMTGGGSNLSNNNSSDNKDTADVNFTSTTTTSSEQKLNKTTSVTSILKYFKKKILSFRKGKSDY